MICIQKKIQNLFGISLKSTVIQDLVKSHKEELDKMNRKLKWYAENQELLDRDSHQLKEKDLEIKHLQAVISNLQSEVRQFVLLIL